MIKDFEHKRIAVILGGYSKERAVSLRSGENIFNALCRTLSVTPLDCVLSGGLGNTTEENISTNNTNETG